MKNFIAICLCLLFVNLTFVGNATNEAQTTKNAIVKSFDIDSFYSVDMEKINVDSTILIVETDTMERETVKGTVEKRNLKHDLFTIHDPETMDFSLKRYAINYNTFVNRHSKNKRNGYKSTRYFARLYPKS
jgi:hypothetical protein